ALRRRAKGHLDGKDYVSAIADYTDVIRKGGQHWEDYHSRGIAYHRKGDLDLALEDYNRAISRTGHDATVHFNRALIHERKNDLKAALSDLDAAIDQHAERTVRNLAARARMRMSSSMHAAAVADYSAIIEMLTQDKSASPEDRAEAYTLRARARAAEMTALFESCRNQQT